MKRYPIPVGAVALLTASLAFWLAGRGDLANWELLAVVMLGGIPLVWETVRQFFHKEFSIDAGQICRFITVEKKVEGLLVLEDVPRADLSRLSTSLRATGIKEP